MIDKAKGLHEHIGIYYKQKNHKIEKHIKNNYLS